MPWRLRLHGGARPVLGRDRAGVGSEVRCTQGGNVANCPLSLIPQPLGAPTSARVAARTLGTQKKPPGRPHESPIGDSCGRPGGSRLLPSVAQASMSHVSNIKAQLPMLTLMHDARALELFEAVH